ncbi:MAG: glutamate synthase, partial [Sulfurovaceae bacterium]
EQMPWPLFPRIFKLSSSQAEGCEMDFNVLSKSFIKDDEGKVTGINCVKIKWSEKAPGVLGGFEEIAGSEFVLKADLVLLAMGFLGPAIAEGRECARAVDAYLMQKPSMLNAINKSLCEK